MVVKEQCHAHMRLVNLPLDLMGLLSPGLIVWLQRFSRVFGSGCSIASGVGSLVSCARLVRCRDEGGG